MGLYLTVFDDDVELDGVEIGHYSDFGDFRTTISKFLEGGKVGSRYPTLILHSDCDGFWTVREAGLLEQELVSIGKKFMELEPVSIDTEWKIEIVRMFGLKINSLFDCFFDVDGEPLIERLIELTKLSQKHGLPILFQ